MSIRVMDDLLYIASTSGLFFVFDLSAFKQATATVKDLKQSDLSIVKVTN